MIGNNSCGVHSIMAGKTDDNIEALEILTYDGQRMHVGATSEEDFNRILHEADAARKSTPDSNPSPTATAITLAASSRTFLAAFPDTT